MTGTCHAQRARTENFWCMYSCVVIVVFVEGSKIVAQPSVEAMSGRHPNEESHSPSIT